MIARLLLLSILMMGPALPVHALVIGTTANYPPFASQADQNHHFVGFEVDIMQAICQRIELPCTFKAVIVSTIPEELMTKKIDLAVAGIIIPSTPEPGFIFSLPYLASDTQFIALKESKINMPADMKGKSVGVRRGTTMGGNLFRHFIEKIYGENIRIQDYATLNDLMTGLNNKQIDAAFINSAGANYWLMNGSGIYKLIGSRIPIGNGYSVMANLGQEELIKKINQALLSMMADGSYLAIYSRYF